MKRVAVVVLAMALSMMFAAVPVFAVPPTRGTFTQVIVEVEVAPGTEFMIGDVLHTRGGTAASYLYGSPWGNSLDGLALTRHFKLNMVSFTGSGILDIVDSFAEGTVVGTVNVEIIGAGPYTYMGPTFDFTLPGVSGTVTHGAVYGGLLFVGFGVKHGISDDLKGLETMETLTGVMVMAGPLAGVHIVENTVTYKLPG